MSHGSVFSGCCKQNRLHAFAHFVFTFVFAGFVAKRIFYTHLNIFVFFVFILVDVIGFPVFWFHKAREIWKKKLFTLAENIFGERKPSCTRLNFGEILFAGTKQAALGGQYRSILPTRFANQNTEFAALLNVWSIGKLVSFVFPRVLMFPSTSSQETSGFLGKKN